jgi:hypothetical protein
MCFPFGNQKKLVDERGGGMCYHFGNIYIYIYISHAFPFGRPKNFGCSPMVRVCQMVIEIL